MPKIKTSELTGDALDCAVAMCEGEDERLKYGLTDDERYSTDWAQGGPIIEREGLGIFKYNKLAAAEPDLWGSHKVVSRPDWHGDPMNTALCLDGPTPLIAAMRCYVASKLGYTVDIPEKLCPKSRRVS